MSSPAQNTAGLGACLVPAVRSALLAGREILEVYRREFAVDTKDDLTPITEADRRAHRVIVCHLGAASPHPILSEEGANIPYEERRHWRAYWLVDPLDGTKEFVKRNDEFTVNIALMDAEGPVLGVVYAPVPGILYFADRSIGSYKLLDPLAAVPELIPPEGLPERPSRRVPERSSEGPPQRAAEQPRGGPPSSPVTAATAGSPAQPENQDALAKTLVGAAQALPQRRPLELDERRRHPRITVMASRSHRGSAFEHYVESLRRYAEEIEIRTLGSALKPCVVAEGAADIYPRFGRTMEWDTAAAHAVVRGVGKLMIAFETRQELTYNKQELVNPSFVVI